MLRLSKLTDYGTAVMTVLARRPGTVCNASEISQMTHVSLPTVSKILKALARQELVESTRGAHGGYRLARTPAEISMAEIITALEGPIALTECATASSQCTIESRCGVRSNWQKINIAVRDALQGISLAEMTYPLPPPVTRNGHGVVELRPAPSPRP